MGGKVQNISGWKMWEHGVPDSRWTVIEYKGKDKNGNSLWLCECSCKNKTRKILSRKNFINGISKSCGCIVYEQIIQRNKNNTKTNIYDLTGEYGIGYASNNGNLFYFDLEDYDKIKDYCWNMNKKGYLEASRKNGNTTNIKMHRLIMGENIKCIDHKNKKPWDNRKNNLREGFRTNNINKPKQKSNTSDFIGVTKDKRYNNYWIARINIQKNKRIVVYRGHDKNEAIKARLIAELKYYGDAAPQRHLFEQYGIEVDEW